MKYFGCPYKGSKQRIADWLISKLPANKNFVDLFAGGCAVAHAAMLSKKYSKVICNDINDAPSLFLNAIRGLYRDKYEWVDRDRFFAERDKDVYIKYCWSFGNNGKDYMYGKEIEPYKRAIHQAVAIGEWNEFNQLLPEFAPQLQSLLRGISDIHERRMMMQRYFKAVLNANPELADKNLMYKTWFSYKAKVKDIKLDQSLNCFDRIQKLADININVKLSVSKLDYQDVELPGDATIYADIPYRGSNCGSYSGFDHDRFYNWCREIDKPVFISEYDMPDDFVAIAQKQKQVCSAANTSFVKFEKIFIHNRFVGQYDKLNTLFIYG
ncbi:MAG: DNA adenine methylase [Prevotella sp.]|nr:DNA adenine methylase [Prevotella sp.]